MSFGAIILLQMEPRGENFAPLDDALHNAVTEIRVEQHLDKQTSFAVRFQEDFEDTGAVEAVQRLFAQSRGMAILVPEKEATDPLTTNLVCLVRGQVENVEFDVNTGGSGSWFEVRGQDTRTLINRKATTVEYNGPSSQFISDTVQLCTTETPKVGDEIKNYVGETYRCRGSELDAVYDLARKSAFHFWLTYEVKQLGPLYQIKATAHVESSPDRNESLGAPPPPTKLAELGLLLSEPTATLKILGEEDECETVVSFNSKVDNEIYNLAVSHGQNLKDGKQETNEESSQAPELNKGESAVTIGFTEGPMLEWGDGEERSVEVATLADTDIAKWQAFAAATEASWYVHGEALTTMHMLKQLLQPHQIVEVVGGGCGIAGKYQVSDVTHVLNPAAHWMQVSLRSNSRNLEQKLVMP